MKNKYIWNQCSNYFTEKDVQAKHRSQAWKLKFRLLVWPRFLSFQQLPFLSVSLHCPHDHQHQVLVGLTGYLLNSPSSLIPLCLNLEGSVFFYPLQNPNFFLRPRPNFTSPVEICSTPLSMSPRKPVCGKSWY